MRSSKETKTGKRIVTVALLLALCASLGVSGYFAAQKNSAIAELARVREDVREEFRQELAAKDDEIAALGETIAEYEESAAALEADIAYLKERLNTKMLTGLDPEHPSYVDKYPDFYAPQDLKANYAPASTVYLTFDDGPSSNTDSVLATLAENDVKATFFVVTRNGYSKEKLKAIADAGHTIGMHSATHDYNTIYASVDAWLDDMYKVFTEIRSVTGQTPTVFRFPGGSINSYNHLTYQEIMAEMLRRGFVPFDWNVSSGDATATTVPKDTILNNVLASTTMSRAIVLMHDGAYKTTTAEALPEIIAGLKEKGYVFEGLQPNSKPVLFQYIDNVKQNP